MPRDARRWHHVILTTYGAWLPGDARGFRTRHHREHVDGDYKSPPPPGRYAARELRSRQLLSQDSVVLDPKLREVVGNALRDKITRLGGWVLCLAVAGQHVHLLAKLPPQSARKWIGQAKKHTTFVMRKHGWQGKLWALRGKFVAVRSRRHQVATYRYILRHKHQRAWLGVWNRGNGLIEEDM